MLESMRVLWSIAHESKNDKKAFERYIRLAVSVAKDAAPYFHSRLATVDPEAAARPQKVVVTIIGGLPVGSTPERPEGTEYNEVPPEEPY